MFKEIAEKLNGGNYSIDMFGDIYCGNNTPSYLHYIRIGTVVITLSLVEYHREVAISKKEYSIELNNRNRTKQELLEHAHELVQQLGCKVVVR